MVSESPDIGFSKDFRSAIISMFKNQRKPCLPNQESVDNNESTKIFTKGTEIIKKEPNGNSGVKEYKSYNQKLTRETQPRTQDGKRKNQ